MELGPVELWWWDLNLDHLLFGFVRKGYYVTLNGRKQTFAYSLS